MLAVIRKDLSEQSFILAPACLLALTGLVALASRGPLLADAFLRAFDLFVLACAAPLALLFVRQLVTVELTSRGLDFLETLPISRLSVLGGKALMGAFLLAAVLGTGAAVTTSAMGLLAEVPPGATSALTARAGAFVLAVYGLAFLLACLGRHRYAALFAGLAALALFERGGVDPARLGPARLARGGFYGAGEAFDAAAIESAALGAAGLVLGLTLACVRRGRLSRAWSGPWTTADAARAVALGLLAAVALHRGAVEQPALRLEGAVATVGVVGVRIPGPEHEARAAEVAALAAGALDDLTTRLELGAALPVAIEPAPGLPPDMSARLDHGAARGLLVRTAWLDPAWDAGEFRAFLVEEALRGLRPAAPDLALDGYALWRAQQGDPALRGRVRLHAAWAIEALGGAPTLGAWDAVHAKLGPDAARSLAAFCLEQLARGDERVVDRLARAGLRARLLERVLGGGADRFEEATGSSVADLDQELARAASALVAERARDLAALPHPSHVLVEAEPDGALRFSVSAGPGCVVGLPCALLHAEARDDGPARLRRDEALVGGPAGRTIALYAPRARVRCAVAVPAPVPGGELVLAWRWLEVSPRAPGGGP